jgi:hypothetical protein
MASTALKYQVQAHLPNPTHPTILQRREDFQNGHRHYTVEIIAAPKHFITLQRTSKIVENKAKHNCADFPNIKVNYNEAIRLLRVDTSDYTSERVRREVMIKIEGMLGNFMRSHATDRVPRRNN